MPENEICYLSELVERNLDEVLEKTEFALVNYVGLTPEEANRTVNITLQHIINPINKGTAVMGKKFTGHQVKRYI